MSSLVLSFRRDVRLQKSLQFSIFMTLVDKSVVTEQTCS
jgi:hypothetical protein